VHWIIHFPLGALSNNHLNDELLEQNLNFKELFFVGKGVNFPCDYYLNMRVGVNVCNDVRILICLERIMEEV
jgi:hypothetical protein